eukprot:GHVS01028512.1.p1 GENE.GHVS01028512.1~~GHVS01028512.1.p1  ORF type:complete len:246 (+),score=39.68 GHVS01028512.1:204-941(+)
MGTPSPPPVDARHPRRPVVVFVLGGPGAGKGTQCSRISDEFGFVHISAGDCLREERNSPNSQYGSMINKHIKEGSIVPVEVTVELLINKMKASGWEKSKFLIDGFPRNQNNLDGWQAAMKSPPSDHQSTTTTTPADHQPTDGSGTVCSLGESIADVRLCLFFDCEEKEMERRLLERGTASGRVDDNPETIRKRFNTFVCETMPIADYFTNCGKLERINAMQPIHDVWTDVRKLFYQQQHHNHWGI